MGPRNASAHGPSPAGAVGVAQAERPRAITGRAACVTQAERAWGSTGRGGGIALNRPSWCRIRRQPSSWTMR